MPSQKRNSPPGEADPRKTTRSDVPVLTPRASKVPTQDQSVLDHAPRRTSVAYVRKSALLMRFDVAHVEINKLIEDVRTHEGNALIPAVARLEEAVGQHVRDEEENLPPDLDTKATPEQLETLGSRIEQSKQRVG